MRTALSVLALTAAVGAAAPGSPHWPLPRVVGVWIGGRCAPGGGDRLVERAMQTWTKAGEGRLTLQRTLIRTEAEIQVFFVRDGGNYGETRPRLDPKTGLIDRADVCHRGRRAGGASHKTD